MVSLNEIDDTLLHVHSISNTSRWASIDIGDSDLLKAIEDPVTQIQRIISALDSFATILKTIIETIAKLTTEGIDVVKTTVHETIEMIRAVLEDFTGPEGLGVHVIGIPALPSLEPRITKALVSFESKPGDDLAGMLSQKVGPLGNVMLGVRGTAGGGGNAGFFHQMNASIDDEEDGFRPQYSDDAYVAGVLFYFGCETFHSLLTLIAKLATLLSDPQKPGPFSDILNTFSLPNFPALRNFKAETTTCNTGSTEVLNDTRADPVLSKLLHLDTEAQPFHGVKFSWDPIPSSYVPTPYPGPDGKPLTYKITKVRLFGDTKPLPLNSPLKMEEKSLRLPENEEFHPFRSEIITKPLKVPGHWYFAACLHVQQVLQENPEVLGSPLPDRMTMVTTAFDIPADPPGVGRQGPSPNWYAIRPTALIPAVRDLVLEVEDFLKQLDQFVGSTADDLKKFVDDVSNWITDYIEWAQKLADTILRILDALQGWPVDVYAGMHPFYGKGGNNCIRNEIGKALFDSSDQGRPPFDKGTEAVYGIMFVVGSETVGKIERWKAFMKALFNVEFGENGVFTQIMDTGGSTIQAAIDSIDRVLATTNDEINFLDNMQKDDLGIQEQAVTIPPAFDEQMQPATESAGCRG